jgi:hypothetical protein
MHAYEAAATPLRCTKKKLMHAYVAGCTNP